MFIRYACFVFLVSIASQSKAETVSAANPDTIVAAVQEFGYKAVLETEDNADPKIRSVMEGTPVVLDFYGCDDSGKGCNGILFFAGFDLVQGSSLAVVNSWNDSKLIGRAYLDDENDPYLDFFVVTGEDLQKETFKDAFDRWVTALSAFRDHIDF